MPLFARSGTGKTTLVSNVGGWLPTLFTPTARIRGGGEVSLQRLLESVQELYREHALPANEARVIPINVDDRESDPPTERELAQIKAFLREERFGHRCLVLWPETSEAHAQAMGEQFQARAGRSPFELPLSVKGPEPASWDQIAIETLRLTNKMHNLELLGVDPRTYDAARYNTIGDYLDAISDDFVRLLQELVAATQKPIQLLVAFASQSAQAGILSDLTGSAHFGLLDADKLLSSTPKSRIGLWWGERRGALVQTIIRLDARVVCLAPSLSVSILRRYGPEDIQASLDALAIKQKPPSDIAVYLDRSDLGRLLKGTTSATSEYRGSPAHDASAAFTLLA